MYLGTKDVGKALMRQPPNNTQKFKLITDYLMKIKSVPTFGKSDQNYQFQMQNCKDDALFNIFHLLFLIQP